MERLKYYGKGNLFSWGLLKGLIVNFHNFSFRRLCNKITCVHDKLCCICLSDFHREHWQR